MEKLKLAQEFRQIPSNDPNKAKLGLTLPVSEVLKLSMEERSIIFAEALSQRPIEEQIAVNYASRNVLNGCCWEFTRDVKEIEKYKDKFYASKFCSVQKVTYSKRARIYGYLVYMQMQKLCEYLDVRNYGILEESDYKKGIAHREEAKMGLIKKLEKGMQGKIGIFCTNDSQTITIDGKVYPAFAVTLKELCIICSKTGYGFNLGNQMRSCNDVLAREDKVIENLEVAPSGNALMIDIGRL